MFFLLVLCGCTNPNKPELDSEQILECILWHLIEDHDAEKSMNIVVSDVKNWTDSTSYISVTIDTKNLYELNGEFWAAKYNGFKIYNI